MDHLDVGEVAEPHELGYQLERARDQGLACNNGGQDCNDQAEVKGPRGHRVEEGVRVCYAIRIISGKDSSLAEVGYQQARVCQTKPRDLGCCPAKCTNVCE